MIHDVINAPVIIAYILHIVSILAGIPMYQSNIDKAVIRDT
jgi:hypothetical protein